jgi:hypothetical protein
VNSDLPSILFNPIPPGFRWDRNRGRFHLSSPVPVRRLKNLEEAAFCSISELSKTRSGKIMRRVLKARALGNIRRRYFDTGGIANCANGRSRPQIYVRDRGVGMGAL